MGRSRVFRPGSFCKSDMARQQLLLLVIAHQPCLLLVLVKNNPPLLEGGGFSARTKRLRAAVSQLGP